MFLKKKKYQTRAYSDTKIEYLNGTDGQTKQIIQAAAL